MVIAGSQDKQETNFYAWSQRMLCHTKKWWLWGFSPAIILSSVHIGIKHALLLSVLFMLYSNTVGGNVLMNGWWRNQCEQKKIM